MNPSPLYLGVKGSVLAIDPATGATLWQQHLKGSGLVNVMLNSGLVLAHTRGELFALNPQDGRILWKNELSGCGYGYVTMVSAASPGGQQVMSVYQQAADEQAAAQSAQASHSHGGH